MASVGPVEVPAGRSRPGRRWLACAGPTQGGDLAQGGRNTFGEGVDHGLQLGAAGGSVGVSVGAEDALVDRPGGLDLNVGVDGEQGVEALVLSLGKQAGAGV